MINRISFLELSIDGEGGIFFITLNSNWNGKQTTYWIIMVTCLQNRTKITFG